MCEGVDVRMTTEKTFIVIYLVSNIFISILLLMLTLSVLDSVNTADKQRANASKERQETLCILKIQPENRTPVALKRCQE